MSQPPSWAERYAAGKAMRGACPRESHATWKAPAATRPDPVSWSWRRRRGVCPSCCPSATGAWSAPPFTFYRGSALAMAADLASTPATGLRVQCCGDAHLCNFGGFATPERKVIFSINDLDETLPAPWEWDVKRLAASFVVACRDNGLSDVVARDVVTTCVRAYRESMAEFSQMKTLELWYTGTGGGRADGEPQGPRAPQAGPRSASRRSRRRAAARRSSRSWWSTRGRCRSSRTSSPRSSTPRAILRARSSRSSGTPSPIPRHPCHHPTNPCWTATSSGTPPSRWWGSAASGPPAGCSSSWPAKAIPSSSRSRRRAPRSWNPTPARASSPTTASAS